MPGNQASLDHIARPLAVALLRILATEKARRIVAVAADNTVGKQWA